MQKITSSIELRNAILILESEQAIKEKLLKEQFLLTYKGLKPGNYLISTLKDAASSPYLLDNILSTAVGLSTGYLSRKIIVGASGNILRRLFGSVLQFGITKVVAQNPVPVKLLANSIFHHLFHKKEKDLNEQ